MCQETLACVLIGDTNQLILCMSRVWHIEDLTYENINMMQHTFLFQFRLCLPTC